MILETTLAPLADALPGLVWTALPDGRVDFINQRWRDYAGAGGLRVAEVDWQSWVHPDDLPGLREDWRRMIDAHARSEAQPVENNREH